MSDQPRTQQLDEAVELLLSSGGDVAYASLKDHTPQVIAGLPVKRNEFVLRAWAQAPPEDWQHWADSIDGDADPSEDEQAPARLLLTRLFELWPSLDQDQEETLSEFVGVVMARLDTHVFDDEEGHPALRPLADDLEPPDWATDIDSRQRREHLHEAARKLSALGRATSERVQTLLGDDLATGLEQAEPPRARPGYGAVSGGTLLEALRGVQTMGQHLGDEQVAHLVELIPEVPPDDHADEASAEISVRCLLTAKAGRGAARPFGVAANRVLAAVRAQGEDVDDAIAHWLFLQPKASELAPVAAAMLSALPDDSSELPNEISEALVGWTTNANKSQRAALIEHLLREDSDASCWLSVVSQEPFTETRPIKVVKERVLGGSAATRAKAATEAQAVHFRTAAAGKTLAAAVTALLKKKRPSKQDVGVAALLVAAVPPESINADGWAKSFDKRCSDKNYTLKPDERSALISAGVALPKDGVPSRVWKAVKSKLP